MYLVIRTELNEMRSRDTFDCFCMEDQVEVSKCLKSGRFKVYKLDSLQEIKEIIVTTEEKVA